jgi:hypothetical protein
VLTEYFKVNSNNIQEYDSYSPEKCRSPSVYSRATDEDGIQKYTGNTMIPPALASSPTLGTRRAGTATLLGTQPAGSFLLGSPKQSDFRPVHSTKWSKDWRAWLSKEVEELDTLSAKDITINTQFDFEPSHVREMQQTNATDSSESNSFINDSVDEFLKSEPPLTGTGKDASEMRPDRMSTVGYITRPRLGSRPIIKSDRPLSIMNERFPMLGTGRKSSSQSNASTRSRYHSSSKASHQEIRTKKSASSGLTLPVSVLTSSNSTPSAGSSHQEQTFNVDASLKDGECRNPESNLEVVNQAPSITDAEAFNIQRLLFYTSVHRLKPSLRGSSVPVIPPSSEMPSARLARQDTPSTLALYPLGPKPVTNFHRIKGADKFYEKGISQKSVTSSALEGDTLQMILEGPYAQQDSQSALPAPAPVLKENILHSKDLFPENIEKGGVLDTATANLDDGITGELGQGVAKRDRSLTPALI